MARLKGEGALKDVPLIAVFPSNRVVEKANKRYAEIQIDQSNLTKKQIQSGMGQSNPYLNSKSVEFAEAQTGTYVDHYFLYGNKQYDAIKEAAGDKAFTEKRKTADGKTIDVEVFGIKADLFINKGDVIVRTDKPMEPTPNAKFGPGVLKKQKAVTEAVRDYQAQAQAQSGGKAVPKDVQKAVPEAQAEAQA